ncbi:AraC family transcriptional regulator [Plantactinospora siamensis]|uniref:AraC family transcriptional regulator n=1 Tax=Plantactinospora siamensis TaxID=555372 RepID=A0ABV6P1P0_9ACTN
MDALAGLLDGPRARGAFLLRCRFEPPWAIRIEDRAPLCLIAMVAGECVLLGADGDRHRLRPGSVAIVRGPEPYSLADPVGTPTQAVIHPGQRCATPDGRPLPASMDLGVRTWGTAADGRTVLLTGTWTGDGEIRRRLLTALPPVLIRAGEQPGEPAGSTVGPLLRLLGAEIDRDDPGQAVVLDRLLDLLLIAVLRDWLGRADGGGPAWYRAHGDPVVGPALRAMHDEPARPWTVAALAVRGGVSRAALARRFTDLVGEPPMAYLTGWRLALAADLLRDPEATVGAVARRVGYASPFALSAAFKRRHGVSPSHLRRASQIP